MKVKVETFSKNINGGNQKRALFDSLVDTISGDLYKYAYWVCQDRQIAEDVVQETFLKIWKNIHQLKDVSAAKSWVFTIFRREHARLFSRQSPVIVPIDEVREQCLPSADNNDISNQFLYNAINTIPADYSEPLLLQVLGGFTCEEIAIILNISLSNVLTRVFRARKKLRKLLSKDQVRQYSRKESLSDSNSVSKIFCPN